MKVVDIKGNKLEIFVVFSAMFEDYRYAYLSRYARLVYVLSLCIVRSLFFFFLLRCSLFASLLKGELVAGEESDGTPGTPGSVYLRVNRRRTDLMPTIPSPRDGPPTSGRSSSAKAFTRSPGRTYSMSRLDQLAQPRKRPTELSTLTEQQSQPLSASSMSRSMSHLAASGGKSLKRSDNSRSMGTLPGAVPMPRPTRAERLRRKAREHQNQQQQGKIVLVHSTRW